MPYGEKLKMIKEARHLTIAQISKICDITLPTATRVFSEKNLSGNFETFVSIAKGLDISLDELAGLKPPDKSIDDLSNLLKEKDIKIEHLIEENKTLRGDITLLREDNKHLRSDNKSLRSGKFLTIGILAVLVLALLAYIIYDLFNGHLGVVRY